MVCASGTKPEVRRSNELKCVFVLTAPIANPLQSTTGGRK